MIWFFLKNIYITFGVLNRFSFSIDFTHSIPHYLQTTLRYVQVTPQDVYLQYARAVAQRIRPLPETSS